MIDYAVVLIVFATIVNCLVLVAGTILLRCTMKLFTEYKKDVHMDKRVAK